MAPSPLLQKTFSTWRFIIAFIGVVFIILIRDYEVFLQPKFLVEDGAIFFADSFNLPFYYSITQPYAGYYHLVPRLIAEAAQLAPLSFAPAFYCGFALFINAFCLSWFALPYFRYIISSDFLRMLFVFMLPLLPNGGSIVILAYVQWPLLIWCVWVSLMEYPTAKWLQISVLAIYLLAIPTIAMQIILLPIWLFRLVYADSISEKKWIFTIVITQIAVIIMIFFSLTSINVAMKLSIGTIIIDLINSLLYVTLSVAFLGFGLTATLFKQFGWSVFYLGGAIIFASIASALWIQRKNQRLVHSCMVLIYITLISLLFFFFTRAQAINFNFSKDPSHLAVSNPRYFWPASIINLLLIFIIIDLGWRYTSLFSLRRLLPLCVICICFMLHFQEFRPVDWGRTNWLEYAQLIDYLQKKQNEDVITRIDGGSIAHIEQHAADHRIFLPLIMATLAKYYPVPPNYTRVQIPINPNGWAMNLYFPKSSNSLIQLPEGITWLGYHQDYDNHSVRVTLFWQGNRWADPINNVYYTAYVHIVDSRQNRIAGTDVLLEPILEDADSNAIFFSTHEIQLPDQLPAGEYSLVIGLYYFDSTNALVPGSSLVIENSIKIAPTN